jgi:hypothetical protein
MLTHGRAITSSIDAHVEAERKSNDGQAAPPYPAN